MHKDGFFFCEVNTMANIIQIEQLCKTFGSGEHAVAALNNVSLQVSKGEIFGIIGLFGFPIALSLITHLNANGIIKLFRPDPPKEPKKHKAAKPGGTPEED